MNTLSGIYDKDGRESVWYIGKISGQTEVKIIANALLDAIDKYKWIEVTTSDGYRYKVERDD